ncbi:MAG: alpha/beta fold hydrolase [Leptolyngbya sp. SIO4C1]|nr:alpha/beta fold hydrolase [Leptolyngbya sp. SIO4C1]
MSTTYLYLHGFASGPQSFKAQALRSRFQTLGLTLQIPDLNQDDFSQLTLSRQIQQVSPLIHQPTVLIGSSFGGLTACWLAEQPAVRTQLQRLILLAPAFDFLAQWLPRLGPAALEQWRDRGWLSVYHYAQQRQQRLDYRFLLDAQQYPDAQLQTPVPTLILHGTEDETIAIEASQAYASRRPWVKLQPLATDHAMTEAADDIWQAIRSFCAL